MWEISIKNQLFGVSVSIILGVLLCVFYDFFRAKRKCITSSTLSIFLEDIIFFILSSIIVFCFLLALTNGSVRGYVIFGLMIGFTISRLLISKYIVNIFKMLIKLLLKLKKAIKGIKNKISNRINIIITNIFNFLIKIIKKVAKFLKKG